MNPEIDFAALPLRDIHLPGWPGWWPPGPGWWIAAVMLMGAVGVWMFWRHRQRHRRAALAALDGVIGALERGEDPARCLQRASTVLRRYVMTVAAGTAEQPVAGLTGARWIEYLDGRSPSGAFAREASALTFAPYRRPECINAEQALTLSRLCAQWVRTERPEG